MNNGIVNSVMFIEKKICLSLNILHIKSITINHPFYCYPSIPETDFTRTVEDGLGIKDGWLYYITVPINSNIYVVTDKCEKINIECFESDINIY